eukprot:2221999-Pyramimonas_sp.AAC.1
MMSATFAFAGSRSSEPIKLWGGVLRELQRVQATLPLWATSWRPPWASDVAASDASGHGIGVCRRKPPVPVVAETGRLAEKVRYRLIDAILARRQALAGAPEDPGGVEPLPPDE